MDTPLSIEINTNLPDLTEVAIQREILLGTIIGSTALAADFEIHQDTLPASFESQALYKQAAAEFGSAVLFQSLEEDSEGLLSGTQIRAAKDEGLATMSAFIESELVCRWQVYNELLKTAGRRPYKCQRGIIIKQKRLVSPGYDIAHVAAKWREDVTTLGQELETPMQVAENVAHAGYLGIKNTLQLQLVAEEAYLSMALA